MRNRAISPAATILSVLLLVFAASPAQAGPVAFSEVVHVMGSLRTGGLSQDLRLRAVSQDGSTPVNGAVISAGKSSTDSSSTSEPTSLISTATGLQDGQQGSVEVIEEGDVTGTVCDCGEIFIPAAGFPGWIALGAVPLVCVFVDCSPSGDTPDEVCLTNCGPGPTPTQFSNPPGGDDTPIPEPATLFLLGSGLVAVGAKARRRYTRSRTENQVPTDTEV